MTEAEKDLKISRRTKCRIWLKSRLAYWIEKATMKATNAPNVFKLADGSIRMEFPCAVAAVVLSSSAAEKLALELLHLTKYDAVEPKHESEKVHG